MKIPRTGPAALISGGEPTVTLAPPAIRGKGGRNTQLVLLALIEALRNPERFPSRFALLSGGTDGEDGPTDAAGADTEAKDDNGKTALTYAGGHADVVKLLEAAARKRAEQPDAGR